MTGTRLATRFASNAGAEGGADRRRWGLRASQARMLLGLIRLVNGALALLVPRRFTKMLGLDPERNGPAIYVLRLFGVRTVILGLQLLTAKGDELEQTVKHAPWIHASDATAALIAGVKGELPRRAAVIAFVTSSLNTMLSFLAQE